MIHPAAPRATRAPALLAALVLGALTGCRTAPAPGLALRPAAAPAVARAAASGRADHAAAAELAWFEANDRAYARARLGAGLAAQPTAPDLRLLRALLSAAELDDPATLDDLLALLRSSPETPEAEAALVLLAETLSEHLGDRRAIAEALERSGLLAAEVPEAERGQPDRGARVALASAILSRLRALDRDEAGMRAAVARGGWLTAWRGLGPIAPRTMRALSAPSPAELRGLDQAGPVELRGVRAPLRAIDAGRLHLDPAAGDQVGLYVLETWVELPAAAEGTPLALEILLRDSGRVLVDGTRVHEVVQGSAEARGRARVELTLSPGWHRISIALLASGSSRPAVSLLGADGAPVVRAQSRTAPPGGGGTKLPPTRSRRALDLGHPRSAEALVERLLGEADHAHYARYLGVMLATTAWRDHLDRARALAAQGAQLAPSSAAMALAEARVMTRAGLPTSLSTARCRAALALDEASPAALAALARATLEDAPDQALQLADRLALAAPRAPEPHALRFRLYERRGWNAEAAESLAAALERGATEALLQDGARFHRGLLRLDAAKALEARALELAEPGPGARAAKAALLAGDVDGAVRGYREAARTAGSPAPHLARIAALELGRGRLDEAVQAAEAALADDPLLAEAHRVLAVARRAKGERAGAAAAAARLGALGAGDLRVEAFEAELAGQALGLPRKGSWLEAELALDPRALASQAAADDLRFRRHKLVHLLERIVDRVAPDGRALSLRHAITRLQTKEATDRAGEVNVPGDAIPLALRTLKANGRVVDVDRHAGKDDLSFSALAPGDAIEKQWISVEAPATPSGGYVRRFYFQGASPSRRSELVVIAPKGATVWWRGYHGAPEPRVREEDGETVYLFRATDVPAVEPEPGSVSQEEYLPFVVVAVNLPPEAALEANLNGYEDLGDASWDVRQRAEQLTAGAASDEERLDRLYDFLAEQIGHGAAREPSTVLATKRGDRTALLLSMLRAVGVEAQLALARPGAAAEVEPPYPSSQRFNQPLIRVSLPTGVRWVRIDREAPWIGKATPDFRGGSYVLPSLDPELPRPVRFADEEVDRWPVSSEVALTVGDDGDAKGTVAIELPGTYGADLREFLDSARRDDVLRGLQGWAAAVLPGAQLEGYEVRNLKTPRAPLRLSASVSVPSFMVREQGHLVSEQFFGAPIATLALGLPSLPAYLRVAKRSTPLWLSEAGERMHVVVTLPPGTAPPAEAPRAFEHRTPWGRFAQSFAWDDAKRTATLTAESSLLPGRVSPEAFPRFRELAQEVLQASRNRLIVPLRPLPGPG